MNAIWKIVVLQHRQDVIVASFHSKAGTPELHKLLKQTAVEAKTVHKPFADLWHQDRFQWKTLASLLH